jgi:ABC-type glycerol-3-phosphate transport system substrate-binding protein
LDSWRPTIDTPAWKKAITFYVDLMRKDGPPGATSNGFNENLTLMANSKAAMWIDATVVGGILENRAAAGSGTPERPTSGGRIAAWAALAGSARPDGYQICMTISGLVTSGHGSVTATRDGKRAL